MINCNQYPNKLNRWKKLRFRSNNTGIGWFLRGSSLELSNMATIKLINNNTPNTTLSKVSFIFFVEGGLWASHEFITDNNSIAATIPNVASLLISQFIMAALLLAVITTANGKTTNPKIQKANRFLPVEFTDKYLQIYKGLNSKLTCINVTK